MLSSVDCERIEAARVAGEIVDGVTGHGGSPVLVDPQSESVIARDPEIATSASSGLGYRAGAGGAAPRQYLKRRDKLSLRHCLARNLDVAWLMEHIRAWEAE